MSSSFKGFDKWIEKLRNAKDGKGRQKSFDEYVINHFGAESLARIKSDSPVITGDLRRGWTLNKDIDTVKGYLDIIENHTPRKKSGDKTELILTNSIDYAVYVEEGHRTRLGKKKASVQRWIPGQFFARNSLRLIDEYSADILAMYVQEYWNKYVDK